MTEKTPYAIMRIGKIHTRAILDAVEWHNTRQIPAGTVEGLPPPEEWLDLGGSYRDRADKILAATGATHEKGKILAVEVIVTASPEWWNLATKEMKTEWWRAQLRFARDLFGPGLLAFSPHVDESTPHAQIVGLPLYHAIEKKPGPKPKKPEDIRRRAEEEANAPKIWRLSHDVIFGGSSRKLAALQTKYHTYVQHLGLARGKDTVGLGIEHQTLKHYKKLLTKMDKDLALIAAELAEKGQILAHYDVELEKGFARQREQRAEIEKDELDLFRRQEEMRVRLERLDQRKEQLDSRTTAVDLREADIETRAAQLERETKQLRQAVAENIIQRLDLDRRDVAIAGRKRTLDEREQKISIREENADDKELGLNQKDREADRLLAQIGIVVGVISGKIAATWDASSARPKITTGELTSSEQDAARDPWPVVLAAALRHAAGMAKMRRSLAAKMRKLLAKVRSRKATGSRLEVNAAKKVEAANVTDSDAQARMSAALQKEAAAERSMREAEERQRAATALAGAADQQRRNSEAAKDRAQEELVGLESHVASARLKTAKATSALTAEENALAAVRSETDGARVQLTAAQEITAQAEGRRQELETEKAGLEKEVDALTAEKMKQEQTQRQIEKERAEVSAEKAVLDRSVAVLQKAIQSDVTIAMHGSEIVLTTCEAGEREVNEAISVDTIAPSLLPLLSKVQFLKVAEDKFDRLLDHLDDRRKYLAERNPDQKEALIEEQADDRKAVNRMWAELERQSQGR